MVWYILRTTSMAHVLFSCSPRTSYDVATKQHWLSVYRHKLLGRFLLKDTSMTRSQSFAEVGSKADAEIRSVVDDMIATLNKSRSKAR